MAKLWDTVYTVSRGVARSLLRGTKERVWETEVPQQGPGAEPQWGGPPQKPETHAEYSTEQNT